MSKKPKHLAGMGRREYHGKYNALYNRIMLILGNQPIAIIGPMLVDMHAWLLYELPTKKDREEMLNKHKQWVLAALDEEK